MQQDRQSRRLKHVRVLMCTGVGIGSAHPVVSSNTARQLCRSTWYSDKHAVTHMEPLPISVSLA